VERKYRREQLHEQSFAALSFQPRLTDATQDIIKRKKDESRQEPLAVAGGLAEGAESRQETYRKNIFGDECTFKVSFFLSVFLLLSRKHTLSIFLSNLNPSGPLRGW
jgi:hypothetical protein